MTLFDFSPKTEQKQDKTAKKTQRRRSEVLIRETKNIYRRAFSETQLLDLVPDGFKEGYTYNFMTGGDVDSLSYLKLILREQNLKHCLFSTWCMAADDVLQMEEWLQAGKIKTMDAYLGEIFPNSYKMEYKKLQEVIPKFGGEIKVFKNHSKIFAGVGDKFAFSIQSSANINTNPRVENGCITIGKDSYLFYKEFFDGINSF